jgi:hypothetical protein
MQSLDVMAKTDTMLNDIQEIHLKRFPDGSLVLFSLT